MAFDDGAVLENSRVYRRTPSKGSHFLLLTNSNAAIGLCPPDAPVNRAGVHFNYLFVFGIIIIAAGIQGFLKGSKASLIAAGILGALVLAGSQIGGTLGAMLALVGSLGIAGKFVPAFLKAPNKAQAIWPAALAIAAIVVIIKALV